MRSMRLPGLGPFNTFLIASHLAPVWGQQALRSLGSLFHGFEDRAHATASIFFYQMLDLPLHGLVHISSVLAGIKLVAATGLLAYLIDFARAFVMEREPDRETLDLVLLLALATVVLSVFPAVALADPEPLRVQTSYFLLLTGALAVIAVERRIELRAERRLKRPMEPQASLAFSSSLSTSPASLKA
jgi:hypothetical protein